MNKLLSVVLLVISRAQSICSPLIFAKDKTEKELTRRLPSAGLLNVSASDLQKILSLQIPLQVPFIRMFTS